MAKIRSSITLELKSGQQITLDLDEVKDIVKSLAKFVSDNSQNSSARVATAKRVARNRIVKQKKPKSARYKIAAMSERKKQAILEHINKQLSSRPRTLSNLLKGISYVPNHLPAIRDMIESQPNVTKQTIGKRIYYSHKNGERRQRLQPRLASSAAAA